MRERPPILDAVRNRGIGELAQRLIHAARRVTSSESDAEEIVRDGFARCCAPQRPGRRRIHEEAPGSSSQEMESVESNARDSEVSTTYSREFEDIVVRCARSSRDRSEDDERRINSFVYRLTMTTCRHLVRTQAQSATLATELARQQCAILESVEDDLCRWSENEETVTRVLDAILTEIARRRDTALGRALKDRLRNELADPDISTTSEHIAAKHGVSPSTLRSSWHYLLVTLLKRKHRC